MNKQEELNKIAEEIKSCQRCPLYRGATQAVPGEGNPEAKVVFIGEAPGFHEDQRGIPFCGAAGRLLDFLLSKAGIRREEVFITNVLKHRPPGNRDPLPGEISACASFLDHQLAVIKPRVVVTLGRFSMAKFLPQARISQVHGQPRFVEFQGRELIVVPMYHPAAALRNGRIKEEEEKDFERLGELLKKLDGKQELPVKKEKKEEQLKLV